MNAARHTRPLPEELLEAPASQPPRRNRARFELIFASLWLAFGLFLLPALIYWVGDALFGGYRENATLRTFYGDFFGDLADGSGRAWLLALGPLLLVYLLRAIFIGVKTEPAAKSKVDDREEMPRPRRAPVRPEPVKRAPSRPARIEPRIGG
jgi:hypothetical protein